MKATKDHNDYEDDEDNKRRNKQKKNRNKKGWIQALDLNMLQHKRTKHANGAKQINGAAQISLCSSKLK